MTIAPVIKRLHPKLDAHQQEVVGHTGGPLLVVAGPGSGKTRCIERRAVNLLLLEEAAPGELVLSTFGRDAAGELADRFSASAQACGIAGAASGVRISTIHSLCHSILAPHAARAGLRQDYELLDERRQHRLLHEEFGSILAPDWHILSRWDWRDEVRAAHEAGRYFDRICDDAIDVDLLMASDQPFAAALGRCCLRYRELLRGRNSLDFAHLQVWADRLLQDGDVAAAVGAGVRHLMVDEFQDTSRIQLRILKRLAGAHGNFVVVGDDDQSIYRFRGASVANLLDFPSHFPGCRTVRLTTNYRSHRDIVAACNAWMDTAADWSRPGGAGQSLRFEKDLVAHEPENDPDYPAVIAVRGADPRDEGRRLGELLRFLKSNRVISSYGQVALLLHSVREWVSGPYLDGLGAAGIGARCEPAGHGRVSASDEVLVTTIHQAKGQEWDVVAVGSLNGPARENDPVGEALAEFRAGPSTEPAERIPDFDSARRHYVGFTRARHLLVLTCSGQPHARFRIIWERAARWPGVDRAALARQRFGIAGAVPRRTFGIHHLNKLMVRVAPRR